MNRDRYLRQQGVEGLDADRLQSLHVTVVGAGAVGNEVVKNLVLMGVGAIDVHDFDSVEVHNLTRSIFLREADVGASKAQVVAARAAEVDPNVRLRAVEGDFWRTLKLADLARRSVVIGAVDNIEARLKLSKLCLIAGVDLVNVGIDSRFASLETFAFSNAQPQACYECHLPESAYRKVALRYSCGWLRRALLAQDRVATTAITASVAGALAVQAALRVGGAPGPGSRRVLLDTRTGASTVAALARNPSCPGCADLVPRPVRIAARGDWQRALTTHAAGVTVIQLSDPIIFDYACVQCAATGPTERFVGHRADEFDERIMRCAACGELAVRVDIRAEASVEDLRQLFGDSPIPAKFLLAKVGEPGATCIDLEE
jgi:molybdopterin/thiamine biosynthesis adenylyltransferase